MSLPLLAPSSFGTNLDRLLKRRQIRSSRPCAIATAHLLRRVVGALRHADFARLIERVQQVGRRLVAAQPREMAVGNIIRRVLGVIRDEAEEDRDGETSGYSDSGSTPQAMANVPLETSNTTTATTSMFSLLSHPSSNAPSPVTTPRSQTPIPRSTPKPPFSTTARDLKSEVIESIEEIIDELFQVDDQIASYALEHIHSNEIILTHTSSSTVQKFLLKAAAKRKFTVIHAEAYSNDHITTHATVTGISKSFDELGHEQFKKTLTAAGIIVILIPDSAIFALMSRVNKVILGTHAVLANGGLVAAAGAKVIAKAASVHKTPVVVVTGVYKLSPVYPFDFDALIEVGDASKVYGYEEGEMVEKVECENPLYDYVPPELVDLYVTNLGGHAPSYLYRIVEDHYRVEDRELGAES